MASPFTVAWLDNGSRVGICPRCIPGGIARNAAACDMKPAGVDEAAGKACATCAEPLVAAPGTGAYEALKSEGVLV